MTLTFILHFVLFLGFINFTTQSIAGVTYMDHFDFEERYRNVHECNPFYWHPLHMPEHCTNMFEKLIRKGISALEPIRIVKKKKSNNPFEDTDDYDDMYDDTLPPYEKMVQLLKSDVLREPSTAEIAYVPGLGAAAVYNQPVSKLSGDYMKAVAKAYRHISFGFGPLYNPIEITTEGNKDENRKNDITKVIGQFNLGRQPLRHKEITNKPKYNIKKKISKGSLTTVLRTKHRLKTV